MAISLKQFLDKNNISFRLFTICSEANIHSLEDLKVYLKQNRNFDKIVDITIEEKSFLTDLCHGIIKQIPKDIKTQKRKINSNLYRTPNLKERYEPKIFDADSGTSLFQLMTEGKISTRSFNQCDDAGIKGLNHLRLFMEEHGSLDKLKLSKKVCGELLDLCGRK